MLSAHPSMAAVFAAGGALADTPAEKKVGPGFAPGKPPRQYNSVVAAPSQPKKPAPVPVGLFSADAFPALGSTTKVKVKEKAQSTLG